MTLFNVFSLLGGLALFLFGMDIMGKALEKQAGGQLQKILSKLTDNPLKGFFLGLCVTAVIQSSSATTVMVVGFVNSGIMELHQAIGVIMGSNVGTTVTSWILSLSGLQGDSFLINMLKPTSFSPVLAFIGILLYMGKSEKRKGVGTILIGFAVLMTGMTTMSNAVLPLQNEAWFTSLFIRFSNPLLGVLVGAVVTGIILAMNVPVGMPIGELLIGDFVAIIVVKQLFGGIGMNFANPALVGRIVLFVSFAGAMNNWVFPDAAVDQLSSATPLAVADTSKLSLLDLFMGVHGGVLGETCALAIVLGLIYLVATKTISIAIPASYVGSMFVFYLIATRDLHAALAAVLSGGLLFGAVFMATDYVTSPFTLKGKLVYGVALGIVTFAIRYWGSYTEGVSFALLFMNLWVPYINDLTRQTPYGYIKPAKKAKEGAGK